MLCDHSSPQMRSLPPNEVGRIAQHVREGDGINERMGDNPEKVLAQIKTLNPLFKILRMQRITDLWLTSK